eukprot:NODE_14_length_51535_cov_1.125049.p32 type:complete len:218 gc:universal NODE_14_length_51535_cov_1.125049:25850-25197(-)
MPDEEDQQSISNLSASETESVSKKSIDTASTKKSKKSKKKKSGDDKEKKKKKKKRVKVEDEQQVLSLNYEQLLERFYSLLKEKNPELLGKRKIKILPPHVEREGSKKSAFINIEQIAKSCNRAVEHLMEFVFVELGTNGALDQNMRLIMKGKFTGKQMENVIKRYIQEYVLCPTCRSSDTQLKKDNRLLFIQCNACGSSRSVQAIKQGYQAQTTRRK